jgi:hypothetical protein
MFTLHEILYLILPDTNDKTNYVSAIEKLPAIADVSLWLFTETKKKTMTHCP